MNPKAIPRSLPYRTLASLDVVLSEMLNRRAFEGLQVSYPPRVEQKKFFAFDCLSQDPEKDEYPVLVTAMRAADWLGYHARGFLRPAGLPPRVRKPRTTIYYGPPGTGKTNASVVIAGELGWPLVTVNPHHFLREVEFFVSKVASEIVERLQHTSNCCIIFDEFDQLIVDRNLQKLPSAFAMLTTTMLLLFADLHERAASNNCMVAFATNYHPILDAAAIRHGRIDTQSCVVYPDFGSASASVHSPSAKPIPAWSSGAVSTMSPRPRSTLVDS
jgi:hypothetical protein